jgi:hypothetical protein
MLRLFYVTFCIAGMVGFWFLTKFLVTGITPEFGQGFGAGIAFIVILLWLGEKVGAFKIIEPSKGVWTPFK